MVAGLSGLASCSAVRTGGSGTRTGGSITCCACCDGGCCGCGCPSAAPRLLPLLLPLPREPSSEKRGGEPRGARPSDSGESGMSGRPTRGLPRGLLAAECVPLTPARWASRRSSCGLLCPSPRPTYDQLGPARAELGAGGSSAKPPGTGATAGEAARRSGLSGNAGCVAGRSGEAPAGRRAAAASNVLSS
jgi:hypothetical protein